MGKDSPKPQENIEVSLSVGSNMQGMNPLQPPGLASSSYVPWALLVLTLGEPTVTDYSCFYTSGYKEFAFCGKSCLLASACLRRR